MVLVMRVWPEEGANLWFTVRDAELEAARQCVQDRVAEWSGPWEQRSEWTWKRADTGERVEIIGIGETPVVDR